MYLVIKKTLAILALSITLAGVEAASIPPQTNEKGTILTCEIPNSTLRIVQQMTLTINYETSTVNNWSAQITEAEIRWATGEKDNANTHRYYTLSRYTGSINIGTPQFATLLAGQCTRQTQKLF